MNYQELRQYLRLPVTTRQDAACKALESHGKRFCVDFGYENAEEKWNALNVLSLTEADMRFLFACGIRF